MVVCDMKRFYRKGLKCWSMGIIIAALIFGLSNLIISANGQTERPKCRYRNNYLIKDYYMVLSSWGCYNFTNPYLIKGELLKPVDCFGLGLYALLIDEKCHIFLPSEPEVVNAVNNSFQNDVALNRWFDCIHEAESCCDNYLTESEEQEGYCPPLWDGWTCYGDYVKAGEVIKKVCPKYAYSNKGPRCHHFTEKTCFDNGTWLQQTETSTCDIAPREILRTSWHISMLLISVIICTPALFILLAYRALRSSKYYMIRNLLLAIICRNTLVLTSKSLIILQELTTTSDTILSQNNTPCKVLTFFEKLAANAVFTCMLLEGIFLHQLLTNVFGTRRNAGPKMLFFYIAGAVISITAAVSWAILMAKNADQNCWIVTDSTNYHWINDSPRIMMLFINVILMAHIVKVLWTTFRSKANESSPGLRTARASLICLPLFGIPFVFVVFRPDSDSCSLETIYYFISYTLEGLQGVFVAIFHCYTDKEVKRVLRKTMITIRQHFNFKYSEPSRKSHYGDDRRTTFSTFADSHRLSNRLTRLDSRLSRQNTLNDPNKLSNLENDKVNFPAATKSYQMESKPVQSYVEPAELISTSIKPMTLYDPSKNAEDVYDNVPSSPPHTDADSDDQVLDPTILFRGRADGIVIVDDRESR